MTDEIRGGVGDGGQGGGLSELDQAVLLLAAELQEGMSPTVQIMVGPFVRRLLELEEFASLTAGDAWAVVQRLLETGHFHPAGETRETGFGHPLAGIRVSEIGFIDADRIRSKTKIESKKASWIRIELGESFSAGFLGRPQCWSDSAALQSLAKQRRLVVPILLLLFVKKNWQVQTMAAVLTTLEGESRIQLHGDSSKCGVSTKWLRRCVRDLSHLAAGVKVGKVGTLLCVSSVEELSYQLEVEGRALSAEDARSVLLERFGLQRVNPMGWTPRKRAKRELMPWQPEVRRSSDDEDGTDGGVAAHGEE